MTTVALFGAPDDQEVRALARRLESRGAEAWIIDLARYPARMRLAWSQGGWTVDGRDLGEVACGYLRSVGRNLPAHASYGQETPEIAGDATYVSTSEALRAERGYQSVRTAVVQSVARGGVVINPPHQQNLHRQKPLMFARLARAGLPVPPSLVGGSRLSVEDFAARGRRTWDGVVHKPVAGIYKTALWDDAERPWGERPALAQRYVLGDTIRCYVLAGRLLTAARIEHGGTVDSSLSQTGISPLELTMEQRGIAEACARALGLSFCGLDLMHDPIRDETWLIDCNLSPMFVNFSYLRGCDIAQHLAEHLLSIAGHDQGSRSREVFGMVREAKELLSDDADLAAMVRRLRDRWKGS